MNVSSNSITPAYLNERSPERLHSSCCQGIARRQHSCQPERYRRFWARSGTGWDRSRGRHGAGRPGEKRRDLLETVEHRDELFLSVVKVRARPGERGHMEPLHEGLRAVTPRPHADSPLVEQARDVVRVGSLQGKGKDRFSVRRVRGPEYLHLVAESIRRDRECLSLQTG